MNTEILTIPCLEDKYAFIIHNHKLNETFLIDAPESYPIIDVLEKKSVDNCSFEKLKHANIKREWKNKVDIQE